jgi:SnoaL-like domain
MQNLTKTVEAYVAMWNETDTARRAELVRTAWRPDGCYTDPQFTAVGHAALERMIATAQQQFHDHHLRLASGLDIHHDEARFSWEVIAADGAPALTGIDFGSFAADGRLTRVVGFFGDLPVLSTREGKDET